MVVVVKLAPAFRLVSEVLTLVLNSPIVEVAGVKSIVAAPTNSPIPIHEAKANPTTAKANK